MLWGGVGQFLIDAGRVAQVSFVCSGRLGQVRIVCHYEPVGPRQKSCAGGRAMQIYHCDTKKFQPCSHSFMFWGEGKVSIESDWKRGSKDQNSLSELRIGARKHQTIDMEVILRGRCSWSYIVIASIIAKRYEAIFMSSKKKAREALQDKLFVREKQTRFEGGISSFVSWTSDVIKCRGW